MDKLQYEQYRYAIKTRRLSLDGLKRIIREDEAAGRSSTPAGLARMKLAENCDHGLVVCKLLDEESDYLYGNHSPSPLSFVEKIDERGWTINKI